MMQYLVILSFALADARVGAAGIPDQPGYVRGEMIYALNNRPTPQCHASTIAESRHGLVAAWFGGTREKHPDVGIWVSRNDGGWSVPVEVATGVEKDGTRQPCWNPVLFQPAVGPLMLFYKVGPSPKEWWGMRMDSTDGGRSWSPAQHLPRGIYGPIKNKPIQLADGTIVSPSSTEQDGWRVHCEISRDVGKSWEVVGPVDDQQGFQAIQPSILAYPDGRLQMLCRSRNKVVVQSWSKDSGRTWNALGATTLPNPNSGIDALTLADGRQLLVYNDTTKGRSPLNVAISSDGLRWNNVLLLENAPGEYSYPAAIQSADGMVHITYTYLRQTITHVVIDPKLLGQGSPSGGDGISPGI